ncbi:MAG TPA: NADH-quinone oxidoreductase subunit J [Bacteroidales bacterium]|nr:NADH-quinone oxidoreductase subunit J [Bacteroidales bacterium]
MAEQIIFYILALVIAVFSIMAVTSKKVIRSATYLLFVLLATAGLFLMLNYYYLFAVQVTVYAGGVMILFIMAIFLTHKPGDEFKTKMNWKVKSSAILSVLGLLLSGYIVVANVTRIINYVSGKEMKMQELGVTMMGTEKYQFLLPFEAMSVLLLACIIGAIMIARKEKNNVESNNDLDK